jgi:DNA repair photolyase
MELRGDILDARARKGRGAMSNRTNRFEPYATEPIDDGWPDNDAPPVRRTEVALEVPRRVITKNSSPDLSFDRSIDLYRGCEHGCIYLGLSPGLDFETRLIARPDAPARLGAELARKGYRPATIALGTNTDPYQPIEARFGLMRRTLEVLGAHRHPLAVVTKGALIERDADILGPLGRDGLAKVGISITSLDPEVSRKMEPRAPHPKRRLAMIRALSEAGCPVRVMVAPVVPGLTDHELEDILGAARDAGAVTAGWITLRLPREVAPLFREWLEEAYPGRAAGVMARVRELHGGRAYDANWGTRLQGQGIFAELMARRFKVAVKRLGYDQSPAPLRTDLFKVPDRPGDQLSLF